jgi:hypothetical protein
MPAEPWADSPKPKKRKGLVIGVAAGVAAVLAVGGVWAVIALSKKGGAASPENAAEALFENLAAKDWNKLAGAVAPSERDLVSVAMDTANGLKADNKQAKELAEATDALWDSITIEFSDLEFSTEDLVEGVVIATVDNGSVKVDADIEKMADAVADLLDYAESLGTPLGDIPRSAIEDQLDQILPIEKDIEDLAEAAGLDELYVVTVQEGGKWYASVSMTIAQYAFDASGGDRSDLGDPIPDGEMMGADKPEDALSNFAKAVEEALDSGEVRELAKALPLAESRLVAVYGAAAGSLDGFLGDLPIGKITTSQHEMLGGHARLTIDLLEFTLMGDDFELAREGDTWTLSAGAFELTLTQSDDGKTWTIEAEEDGQSAEAELSIPEKGVIEGSSSSPDGADDWFEFDGECLEVGWTDPYTGETHVDSDCGEDAFIIGAGQAISEWTKLPDLKGIVAVTALKGAGDKWYISPIASLVDLAGVFGK